MTTTTTPRTTRATPSRALRAALYGRVSHANKDRGQGLRSVDEQEAENRAACAANGWGVAMVYREKSAISASRFSDKDRPEWLRLVADLDAGRYDVLVLWEPSRGSRDAMVWQVLLDALRRQEVLLHIVSHRRTYDLANAREWRSLAEDGIDSAYESEQSSGRIKRAMTTNADKGRPHGQSPYGYTNARKTDAKPGEYGWKVGDATLLPDPETAPVVVEIVTRLASAEPVSTVTDDLNARGVPAPKGTKWNRSVVRRIAMNPAYAAQRIHKGEPHPGNWAALVDPAVSAAARRVLEDPARRKTRPGRSVHLLSYLATCAVCGAVLSVAMGRRKDGSPVYVCADAGHVQVGCSWLDGIVVQSLLAGLIDLPGLRERLAVSDDSAVIEARALAMTLRAQLDHHRDEVAEGRLSVDSLARIEVRLVEKIAAADLEARGSGTSRAVADLAAAADPVKHWDSMALGSRRDAIRSLLTVSLHRTSARGPAVQRDYGRVSITWNEPTTD